MLDYLINLISRIGYFGYLIIFAGAALESAAFLGLLVPGESLVLVTGFLASQGVLDLDLAIWAVAVGAVIGDSIGYEMGRHFGRPALLRYGSRFGLNQARIDKADAFFKRHGGKSVLLGRFVGFARAIVPFLAGSTRMNYRIFLAYNALGGVLWSSATVLLGYFLGESWRFAQHWIGEASAIVGGIALFGFCLVWLYRVATRNEQELRQRWYRLLTQPRVVRYRQRYAPQIAFVRARLSPSGYLGLHLTLGALVLVGASWLFGGIAEDMLTGDPLTIVDVQVTNWFHERATPSVTQFMLAVSHLNGPVAIPIYLLVATLYFIWKRSWYWFTCLLVTVPSGALLNVLMKYAFQRARPSFEHPILTLNSYSFPSGHASGSTLFFGLLAAYLVSQTSSWRWRVAIVLSTFALVALVSLSRMYLGVHYLSDVLAGMAEAVAWLALCLVGVHTYWKYRAATKALQSQ
ncbi:bifunctional DedA family/phosphatase PAP2 family protein [Noviherbaspirillum massiliense]|uniref:bifunctional DedA family/phosphatase PAP2 family protein n=1 Tax=Noviherbaspirillum massiliense TaxID=1465823 RepID=UPI00030B9735|nr:bifunctional DedA family/phosphatase PAP2 family protein [Noviherbaspirillum massiliense]